MTADAPRAPAAERIRTARLRAGLDERTMAARLDLTFEAYWDLEAYDDEVFMCLSLREVRALGEILGVSPAALVIPAGRAMPAMTMEPEELVRRLAEHIRAGQWTVESFGDHVGWDVSPVLDGTAHLLDYWNIDGLSDVCHELQIDWLALLV